MSTAAQQVTPWALLSSRVSGWWPLLVCCPISFCLPLGFFPVVSLVNLQFTLVIYNLQITIYKVNSSLWIHSKLLVTYKAHFSVLGPLECFINLCLLFLLSTEDLPMPQAWFLEAESLRHCSKKLTFCEDSSLNMQCWQCIWRPWRVLWHTCNTTMGTGNYRKPALAGTWRWSCEPKYSRYWNAEGGKGRLVGWCLAAFPSL